jgi:hypothetical protein
VTAFTLIRYRSYAPRRPRSAVIVTMVVSTAAAAVVSGGRLWALKAAGLFKEATAITGVEHYVSALEKNMVWLGITAIGLVLAVVALMHMAGHSRAHDYAIKALVGIGILACLSGIVA